MTIYPFQSPLAPRMQAFMEMRRALGRKAVADRKILRYIDRFLIGVLQPGEPITREIFHQWLNSIESLSPATRITRVGIFRQFCRYLSYFDRRTHLIPYGFLPRESAQFLISIRINKFERQWPPPGESNPRVLCVQS